MACSAAKERMRKRDETFAIYHDHCTASYDYTGRVRHLSFAIPRNARVISDILVPNGANPQLGAVIENAHRRRGLHRISILVPQYFWHWRSVRLTI